MIKKIIHYFKFRKRLDINKLELGYLSKYPQDQHEQLLINLRFEVWVKQNKTRLETIDKVKMRSAFAAGWTAKDWTAAQ